MQGKGLLLRGKCSIVNSHGEQVHVNESFFNTMLGLRIKSWQLVLPSHLNDDADDVHWSSIAHNRTEWKNLGAQLKNKKEL